MRLIFIEGVSGVGKSTMTQKLCDKLGEMGYVAASYLEFDFTNPIDFYCTAYFTHEEYDDLLVEYSEFIEDIKSNTIIAGDVRLVRYYNRKKPLFTEPLLAELRDHEFCWKPVNLVGLSEYTRVYKMVWENFMQKADVQFDYLLFDGSLLHHPINDMMRNYNISFEQAAYHVNCLIDVVSPLHPLVIYLTSDNVAARLLKARISRKETVPSNGQIKFWEERKQMDFDVLRQLSKPCDSYDISHENWDALLDLMVKRILETD